jgi:drug/metabolite transporter (DMT)-like permease
VTDRRAHGLAVPLRAIAISVAIHVLWGGNPVAVKFSLEVFPPLWTGFFRFVIGIGCIVVFARVAGIRVWPAHGEWPSLLVLGLIFTVQIALMNVGYDMTTAAMGSILIATNPFFASLLAHWFLPDDRLTRWRATGLAVAFTGTALVLLKGEGLGSLRLDNWGNWVVLASAMLLGSRLVFSARLLQRIDEVRVAVWQMAISLPLFAAGGLAFETIHWERLSWEPLAALVYQGAIVAGIGFTTSFYLMKRYTPSIMVSFNFISPVAGVLLSAWLLSEAIAPSLVLGMAAVAAGLFLIAQR